MNTTTPEHTLTHTPECTDSRPLDVTTYPEGIDTLHCVDCGAHEAFTAAGDPIAAAGETGAFHADGARPVVARGVWILRG